MVVPYEREAEVGICHIRRDVGLSSRRYPVSRALDTAASQTPASLIWKTPSLRRGISTPLFSLILSMRYLFSIVDVFT